MRTCFLLPLLLLVAAALARPAVPDVPSEGDSAARLESHSPELHEKAQPEVDGVLIRGRRSPQNKDRGNFSLSVRRQPGVGTEVRAQGQANVWTSRNGNTKVFAQGEWNSLVGGPGRSKPNAGVSIGLIRRF